MEVPPVPVHRPSAWYSSCMQRQVRSVHTVQVCGDFTVAAFEQVVDVPVVVRQGSGRDAQITVEVTQLQFFAKVDVLVIVQRQVLWSKQCRTWFGSPQLQLLDKVIDVPVIFNDTCPWQSGQSKCKFLEKVADVPVISTTRAHGGPDRAVLGQVMRTCPVLCTTGACGGPDRAVLDKC